MEAERLPRYPIRTDVSSRGPGPEDYDNTGPESGKDQGPRRFGRAALIVDSRSRAAWSAAAVALDYLGLLGVPVNTVLVLEDPARLPETVREAIADGHDLIVLGGGDGSVSSVAGILAESDAVLGLLPLGTANDFARTLGIPFELEKACLTVADGAVARVDLGLAGGNYFVNAASIGLGSAVAEALSPRFGHTTGTLAYPVAAVRAYMDREPFEAGIGFPDDDHEAVALERLVHVAVGNGRCYDGGTIAAPGVSIDDQTLDVYAIESSDLMNLTRIAWGLRNGSFVEDECVHHWRTRRVWIVTEPRLPVNLDGELVSRTPRHFSVVPDAMNVLVPRASAGPRVARQYEKRPMAAMAS
ncbi:MAG: YegS/Rv2252/BmrU family lipid kinase [Rubrobacteraceae bacterium]